MTARTPSGPSTDRRKRSSPGSISTLPPHKAQGAASLVRSNRAPYRSSSCALVLLRLFRHTSLVACVSTLLLLGGLVGCATVQAPQLPTDVPAAWSHKPADGALAPDLRSWWTVLGDPQLNNLVEQALAQNLSLAQARSRLRQARMLAGVSGKQYLPSISLGARPVQDVSALDSYFQVSLDSVWELGLFGARQSAEQTGQARLDAAASGVQAAKVSTVAEVVRSYIDLRAAQQQQTLVQRIAAIDARSLDLMEVQRRQRLGSQSQYSQASVRLAQSLAQQSQPKEVAAHAAQGLATLLGKTTPDAAWTQTTAGLAQPSLQSFTLQQVPADLLRYRPDIRSAEAEVLKATADLGLARADLYPRVSLGLEFLYSHNLTQNSRRNTDIVHGFGPTVDIPLFDWGRRRAAADAQQEALDASVLAYRQAVLEGMEAVESALTTLQQSQERVAQLQTVCQALDQRVKSQSTLSKLGLASELDRLEAERNAVQAAVELAAAQASHTLAFVALYKSLGGAPLAAEDLAAASTPEKAAQP